MQGMLLVTMETGSGWTDLGCSRCAAPTGPGRAVQLYASGVLPEDGQAQRPEHQRQPQVQFGSRLHVVLASEHQGGVERAEHEGLAPAGQKDIDVKTQMVGNRFNQQVLLQLLAFISSSSGRTAPP